MFEVEWIAPVMLHVLCACWKDWEELFPLAGRGSQQLPVVNIPLLVSGALWSQPLNVEAYSCSFKSRRMDWGKDAGALAWGRPEGGMASSSSETPRDPASSSSPEAASSSANSRLPTKIFSLGIAGLGWSAQTRKTDKADHTEQVRVLSSATHSQAGL